MFRFITRQHFLVNLLLAIALLIALFFGFLKMLGVITRHNQYEKVPEVKGKTLSEATKILEGKGFRVEVQDSIWDFDITPLSVVRMSPEGGQMVKSHRRIYLTVNRSQPPLVDMPNLVGLSFRNAELFLTQLGLRLGDTTRKPDIAKDAVLEQLYNNRPIQAGARLFVGSTVDLVLGSGLGSEEMDVPDLFGMTFAEAKSLLSGMGLNVGALLPERNVRDTAQAFVYRQNPNTTTALPEGGKRKNKIRTGQSIDLWLSASAREREMTPEEETPEQEPQ